MLPFLALLALAADVPDPTLPPPVKTAAATPAPNARQKTICKRFVRTGSLVDSYRVCKTQDEWDHDADNIRQGFNHSASCQVAQGQTCF